MPTISELVAKHSKVPGDIVVKDGNAIFYPYFQDNESLWHGLNSANKYDSWDDLDKEWQLYTEPKVPIKRWLWVDKYSHIVSDFLYLEGELPNNWIKLIWSETEFDK
jgi:hypothetical protein